MKNYTPFPNKLIDEVMPTLRDTEWRVLCVILSKVAPIVKTAKWLI